MIEKYGYIFIAHNKNKLQTLFGKATSDSQLKIGYENLFTNDISPFDEEDWMDEVRSIFANEKRHGITRVIPGRLNMQIAETKDEADCLNGLDNLIAIQIVKEKRYKDMYMFGPINPKFQEHNHGVLPCSRLDFNGNLPFKKERFGNRTFDVAIEARYQLQRQGDCGAMLATFNLEILK